MLSGGVRYGFSVSLSLLVVIFKSESPLAFAVDCFSKFCKFLLNCSLMSLSNCTVFSIKLPILFHGTSFQLLFFFLCSTLVLIPLSFDSGGFSLLVGRMHQNQAIVGLTLQLSKERKILSG